MVKSVSKLVPKVPGLPAVAGVSRRQQFSASTRRTLLEVAQRLFTEQGYASTSLDAIVAGADVTKGALYHHFTGKQALFEAVFTHVETAGTSAIAASMQDHHDPWTKSTAGLATFLEVVRDPSYRRIVVQEGPAVLGYERFREHEERSSYAVVEDLVRGVLDRVGLTEDQELVATFAQIFFGGLQSAGEAVAAASDPEAAAARVETALSILLGAMKSLAERDQS